MTISVEFLFLNEKQMSNKQTKQNKCVFGNFFFVVSVMCWWKEKKTFNVVKHTHTEKQQNMNQTDHQKIWIIISAKCEKVSRNSKNFNFKNETKKIRNLLSSSICGIVILVSNSDADFCLRNKRGLG